jgi:hypothetical protein
MRCAYRLFKDFVRIRTNRIIDLYSKRQLVQVNRDQFVYLINKLKVQATRLLRQFVVGFSPRRTDLIPGQSHFTFVVDKVAMG